MRRPRPDRGMSFIEVMIALAIFVVLSAMVYMILFGVTGEMGSNSITSDMENQARHIIDQISKDLRSCQNTTLPAAGTYSSLTFSTVSGYSMDAGTGNPGPVTGSSITWALSAADGAADPVNGNDDNNDGLIDECRITRTDSAGGGTTVAMTNRACPLAQKGLEFVVARTAGENGVLNDADDKFAITVTVTLQGLSDKRERLTRAYSTRIAVRN